MTTIPPDERQPLGLQHPPLRQAVLDEVRRAIVEGTYEQGERLYEEEIAGRLQVSRNPVREALQALATEGFVLLEPRRGARVSVIDQRRADELFEVRGQLEALVGRLAARRRTEEQVGELRAIVKEGFALLADGGSRQLPELNTRFHESLARAADNQLLDDTLMRMSHVIQWVYARKVRTRGEASWLEHDRIVEAVAAADEAAAAQAVLEHIEQAHRAYLEG